MHQQYDQYEKGTININSISMIISTLIMIISMNTSTMIMIISMNSTMILIILTTSIAGRECVWTYHMPGLPWILLRVFSRAIVPGCHQISSL